MQQIFGAAAAMLQEALPWVTAVRAIYARTQGPGENACPPSVGSLRSGRYEEIPHPADPLQATNECRQASEHGIGGGGSDGSPRLSEGGGSSPRQPRAERRRRGRRAMGFPQSALEDLRIVQLSEEMLERGELGQDAGGAPRGPPERLEQVAESLDRDPGRMGFLDLIETMDRAEVGRHGIGGLTHGVRHHCGHPLVWLLRQLDFPAVVPQRLGEFHGGFGQLRHKTLREHPPRTCLLPVDLSDESSRLVLHQSAAAPA